MTRRLPHLVSKGLKEAGFAVDVANDGVDGLHLGETEPYDAAVVDIMLPGLDGISLIEKAYVKKRLLSRSSYLAQSVLWMIVSRASRVGAMTT